LGSDLPDLDLFIGKHRKTLHAPYLALLTSAIPDEKARVAYLLGFASHLITDKFSKQISAYKDFLSFIERMMML